MERVTFRVPDKMKADVRYLVDEGYFANDSEAWRTAGRLFRDEHGGKVPDRNHPHLDEDGNFIGEES